MGEENDVVGIDRANRRALLDCGCVVPVTHWFGTRGEDCEPARAVVCVCGNADHGWFTVDLQKLEYVSVH